MAGIYVHIPFCGQFCTYCSFYSVKGRGYREKYIAALHNEIEYRKHFFKDTGVSPRTIYFGGGTPSLFSPVQLGELLQHIKEAFNAQPHEVSIEVNPDDITPQYALQLRNAGFNRVSMGIQSFVEEHLKWMNRRHTAEEGEQAYHNLREAGFRNISLDLIFGYSGLTPQLWEYNLKKMVELFPEHISAYQMSIEPGSALAKMYEKGEYHLVPDEICLREYTFLQEYLASNGYTQYEVSNFARCNPEGEFMKSHHNSSYWTREPYIGLGPAAHSFNGAIRSWNNPSVAEYCRHYSSPEFSPISGCGEPESAAKLPAAVGGFEELQGRDIFNESVMLGLRTVAGVDLGRLNPLLLDEVRGEIERHCRLGNLVLEGDKIRIPSCRLFVSDGIISDLFV